MIFFFSTNNFLNCFFSLSFYSSYFRRQSFYRIREIREIDFTIFPNINLLSYRIYVHKPSFKRNRAEGRARKSLKRGNESMP